MAFAGMYYFPFRNMVMDFIFSGHLTELIFRGIAGKKILHPLQIFEIVKFSYNTAVLKIEISNFQKIIKLASVKVFLMFCFCINPETFNHI